MNITCMCGIKLHYGVGLSQYIGGIISINSGLNIIYSGLNIMHVRINLIYSVGLSQIMDPTLCYKNLKILFQCFNLLFVGGPLFDLIPHYILS